MASGQQAVSTPTNHPLLGPSVAILDDRTRSRGNLLLGLACICLGPVGVYFGIPDLASGSTVLGLAYVGGGFFLLLYGLWLTFLAAGRLRHPVALVVGRDGFEAAGGSPVSWDEVATISDPASPPDEPRLVRIQLADPDDYVDRHGLGAVSRQLLRQRDNDLVLDRGMAMPVAEVQAVMREYLAEYRRSSTGPRGRRPRGKRP